jgi:predicted Zn-dependent protease with MMP-like domain
MKDDWKALQEEAERIVRQTVEGLPAELAESAARLPVIFKLLPAPGEEDDLLGVFLGPTAAEPGVIGPPHIELYLHNLWDFAEEDPELFREEVRITFLHELGHYLGWDEDELEARGLG